MYGSTIIGVVGPPYPYCSLVAFCTFAWLRLCAFSALMLLVLLLRAKSFCKKKKNKEFKTALITSFTLLLMVIKTTFKDSKNLKELEIMY